MTAIFKPQKIGESGYIYVLNSKGETQVHPRSELIGSSLLQVNDFSIASWSFVLQQIKKKNGYLEYLWKNPNDTDPGPRHCT